MAIPRVRLYIGLICYSLICGGLFFTIAFAWYENTCMVDYKDLKAFMLKPESAENIREMEESIFCNYFELMGLCISFFCVINLFSLFTTC